MTLKTKDLLTLAELSPDEIYSVLSRALECKRGGGRRAHSGSLAGKTVAMIFEKPSTRTRVSFEAGVVQLGGHPVFLSRDDLQLSRGETIEDTARTLSRYTDAIVVRTFEHARAEALAEAASVPVINGLSDDFHPCQTLADLLTVLEKKDRLTGVKMAYVGDGNNVVNSLLIGAARVGVSLAVACPRGYEPLDWAVDIGMNDVRGVRHKVAVTNDPLEAVDQADVVYTDVWVSMGQEDEREARLKAFDGFQVNAELLSRAKRDCMVMHCLPAHRGEEVTADVIDGPRSVVFDQAENRMHVQKAVLSMMVGDQ